MENDKCYGLLFILLIYLSIGCDWREGRRPHATAAVCLSPSEQTSVKREPDNTELEQEAPDLAIDYVKQMFSLVSVFVCCSASHSHSTDTYSSIWSEYISATHNKMGAYSLLCFQFKQWGFQVLKPDDKNKSMY